MRGYRSCAGRDLRAGLAVAAFARRVVGQGGIERDSVEVEATGSVKNTVRRARSATAGNC